MVRMGPAKCPLGFQGRENRVLKNLKEKRQTEGKGKKGEKKGVTRRGGRGQMREEGRKGKRSL